MVQVIGEPESGSKKKMAEDVGFEPTEPFGPSVFKTAALNHSANLPHLVSPSVRLCFAKVRLGPARAFRPPTPRADIGEVFGSGSRIRTDDLKSYEPCELASALSR